MGPNQRRYGICCRHGGWVSEHQGQNAVSARKGDYVSGNIKTPSIPKRMALANAHPTLHYVI
jgi:hypothetical protein